MVSDPIDVRSRDPYSVDQFRIQSEYESDLENVIISRGEIEDRIARMADEISARSRANAGTELYAMCVLKGALRFFGRLTPDLEPGGQYSEGVVRASRYADGEGQQKEAEVRFLDGATIEGKDVLIVEDIIDEGYTLKSILEEIQTYNPNSVEIAVLFDKTARRQTDIDISYTGFIVPDVFLVGYGLDYGERYRNLDHLGKLRDDVI